MPDLLPAIQPKSGLETCAFCGRESGSSRPLVRSQISEAQICLACAEIVVATIEDSCHPKKSRREMLFGACCIGAMVFLGVVLAWHNFMGTGQDRVLGSIAVGGLLLMGVMPWGMIVLRRERN